MGATKEILAKIDKPIVFIYLAMVIMGWLNIYAAVYSEQHSSILDFSQQYGKQLIWIFAAFAIAISILMVETRFFPIFAYFIYGGMLLLLIAVIFLGKEVNGARGWFEIGPVRLQPAEFAKLATLLALSKYLSQYGLRITKLRPMIIIGGLLLLPMLLILLQNDTGSALVFVALVLVLYRQGMSGLILALGFFFILLFFLALILSPLQLAIGILVLALGIFALYRFEPKELGMAAAIYATVLGLCYVVINVVLNRNLDWFFILTIAFAVAIIPYSIFIYKKKIYFAFLILGVALSSLLFAYSVNYVFYNVLQPHQRTRIDVLLGKQIDNKGAGYNVNQSKIAIGSGGFAGKGFLQGTQTKFNFVPEQSTDFIFCTVGEEWGFLGTTTVLALFVALLLRILFLAEKQRSPFSRIYAYGVVSIMFFHVAINVGMTIGLMPVIGIPLPFFSYGGSSLWSFTVLLFIFVKLNIDRDRLVY